MTAERIPYPRDIMRVRMLGNALLESSAYDSDPYQSACAAGVGNLLMIPEVEARTASILSLRSKAKNENLPVWALERMTMSACHMIEWSHIREQGLDAYQPEHTDYRNWQHNYLKYIAEGNIDNLDYHKFQDVLGWTDLNTIKPNRRVATEFVLKRYFTDRPNPVDILDVGCSRNDLLVMMAYNWPRKYIQMLSADGQTDYSPIFNEVINGELPELGQKMGMDRHPYPDPLLLDLFEANYLRFQKSNDKELRRLCYELGSQDLRDIADIKQVSGDISDEVIHTMSKRREKLLPAYDLIICSFMMYQMNEQKKAQALANAKSMLKSGGLLLITDIMSTQQDNKDGLEFPDSDKGKVHTVAYEEEHPEYGYQELFEWKDGECTSGTVKNSDLSDRLWQPLAA